MRAAVNYKQLDVGSGLPNARPHEEHVNPFLHRLEMSAWDWVKVIINTLWLLPLRLLFLVLPSLAMGMVVLSLAILGERYDENHPHPLRGWRRFLSSTVGGRISRLFLFGFGFHWIRIKGCPAPTEEAPIWVVSPHSSLLDPFIISMFGLPTYVVKQEVRNMPLFGFLVSRALRAIYVVRSDPASRQGCTREIQRRARSTDQGWPKVMIFPEATTTSRQCLLQFKKGAFLPALPVQAVAIKFQNRLNTMVWSDRGVRFFTSLFLTLCQFHNSLEVEFLPVHTPTPSEVADPELFAESVRREVSAATQIPLCDFSVDDMMLCRAAEATGLPFSSGLVGYPTAHRALQLSLADMKLWLGRFAGMDTDGDGRIMLEDFLQALQLPNDACTQAIFSTICKTPNGMSFKNYLYGVVGMSLKFSTDESLNSIFEHLDIGHKGHVTLDDITFCLPVQWMKPEAASPSPPRRMGSDLCGCGQRWEGGRRRRRRGGGEGQENPLVSFPAKMDRDQFYQAMRSNREYILLYHECQSAAISAPSSSTPPLLGPSSSSTPPLLAPSSSSTPPLLAPSSSSTSPLLAPSSSIPPLLAPSSSSIPPLLGPSSSSIPPLLAPSSSSTPPLVAPSSASSYFLA